MSAHTSHGMVLQRSLAVVLLALAIDWALHRTTTFPVPAAGGILVTGGGSGIGRDAALALSKHGFTVFVGVRKHAQIEMLRSSHPDITPLIMDVTDEEQVRAARHVVEAELARQGGATGPLPFVGIVNNAGVHERGIVGTAEHGAAVRRVMDVNFFGAVTTTDVFLPLLVAAGKDESGSKGKKVKGARIVNISSLSGIFANSGNAPYTASKHAMEAWSDAMRRQLRRAHSSISVSVVQPGFINTGMQSSAGSSSWARRCPS